MPYKYEDRVLISSCMRNTAFITKEPFTHESLLLDKKEYQLSDREKALAFKEYQHDKKYFPYTRPSYNSLLYPKFPSNPQQLIQNQHQYSNYLHGSASSFNLGSSPSSSSLYGRLLNESSNESSSSSRNLDFSLHRSLSTSTLLNHNTNSYFASASSSQTPSSNSSSDNPTIMKYLNSDTNVNGSAEFGSARPPPVNQTQPSQIQNLRDVKISCFVAPSQIVIPSSTPSVSPCTSTCEARLNEGQIVIQPGEKVYILKTPKGCYLRTQDKKVCIE